MTQDVHDITATDWQPALHDHGAIVEDLDDIEQCIAIILATPKGSVPHRPDFGSDIWRHLDKPIPDATLKIRRATIDALRTNEPRIIVDAVDVASQDAEQGRLTIRTSWRLAGSPAPRTSEVQL